MGNTKKPDVRHQILDRVLDKLPLYKLPMWFKMLLAKILLRTMQLGDNEIILFNELRLWIETGGRPTTSNPNYWINKEGGSDED